MVSVDDIANQITTYLSKHPDADYEDIGAGLGRAPAFIHGICQLTGIKLGEQYKGTAKQHSRPITTRHISGKPTQVQIPYIDYCHELMDFQEWCSSREFNYKLGLIFAMRLFRDAVDKSSVWKVFIERLPEATQNLIVDHGNLDKHPKHKATDRQDQENNQQEDHP